MKKVTKISTGFGILASGFLLNACENSNSVDELNQQVEEKGEVEQSGRYSIAVPMSSDEIRYVDFLQFLSNEIVKDHDVAKEFTDNPQKYCADHGFPNLPINMESGLLKFILQLGNDQLNNALKAGDASGFVASCKQNGILDYSALLTDQYLHNLSNRINIHQTSRSGIPDPNGPTLDIDPRFSAVYGFLAVVVAAVAVEAVVVLGTTTWVTHVHGGDGGKTKHHHAYEMNNSAAHFINIQNSTLKNGYMISDKVNEAIVEEGYKVVEENFPEVYKQVDKNTLRNIILTSLQKDSAF